MQFLFSATIINLVANICAGFNGYDSDGRLLLTPLINANEHQRARLLASVQLPNAPRFESYSGYLTVNEIFNSNLYFWFIPNVNKSAPVVLWLSGGPGASSIGMAFMANGPVEITDSGDKAVYRQHSWTRDFHMLFVDNPVGTGFSFANDERGYVRNQKQMANDLFEGLQQFFTLFAELQDNEFYITGESYAGKYIPALGFKIDQESATAKMKLKGLAIGNGLIDPVTQIDYASLLYQVSLLNIREASYLTRYQQLAVQAIHNSDFTGAAKVMNKVLLGGRFNDGYQSWFRNVTGQKQHYNYVQTVMPKEWDYYDIYLNLTDVKKAMHVGKQKFVDGANDVARHLTDDLMRSTKDWLEYLIDRYRVMIYSGNLDVIVGTPLTQTMLQTLNWSAANQWKVSKKRFWKVNKNDTDIAGYVKKYKSFYYVVIRGAGHVAPADKPRETYDLLTKFIRRTL